MKFFPKPTPALCPCSPDLPWGCCNIPCRAARGKELHLPHQVPQLLSQPSGLLLQPCFPRAAAAVHLHLLLWHRPQFLLLLYQSLAIHSFYVFEATQITKSKIHIRESLWCDPALTSPTCADLKTIAPGNTLPSDFFLPPVNSSSEFQKLPLTHKKLE